MATTPGTALGNILGQTSMSSVMKDWGAGLLQTHAAVNQFRLHFCATDFVNGHPEKQCLTHHMVARISDDMMQCLIFDSNMPTARLVGVEYVISQALFNTLPDAEKELWHSHAFEAKQGLIVAPGLPAAVEAGYIKEWAQTYGKNWSLWNLNTSPTVPMGCPQLMMAPVRHEDIDANLMMKRDQELGIDTSKVREARQNLDIPSSLVTSPKADVWTQGKVIQCTLTSGHRAQ